MSKFSIYIFLVFTFLAFSRGFSEIKSSLTINNEHDLKKQFSSTPITLILMDHFVTGLFIKTYYQQYKVVYPRKPYKVINVKTSKEFVKKNLKNIGLSIFRKNFNNEISIIPMPPGTLFLNNPIFGKWITTNGEKTWSFNQPYKHFIKILGWGDFRPSYQFYKTLKLYLSQDIPYYGLNEQFGTDGSITKKNYRFFSRKHKSTFTFKEFIIYFYNEHFSWNKK